MDRGKRRTLKHLAGVAVAGSLPRASRASGAEPHDTLDWLQPYNPVWTSRSANAGESMPCGAGDIGLNVWVEGDDVLFYVARSGAFDETNSYLKLGRVRVRLDPSSFGRGRAFRQELRLAHGEIAIEAGSVTILLWADPVDPIVHVAVESGEAVAVEAIYETWRTHDRDYLPAEMPMHRSYDGAPVTPRQVADDVGFGLGGVVAVHYNRADTVFDLLVAQQGLTEVADQLWNPLQGLGFGLSMDGPGLRPAGRADGRYATTDYHGWRLSSRRPARRHALRLVCHVAQAASRDEWAAGLRRIAARDPGPAASRRRSHEWWRAFWGRSHIAIEPGAAKPDSAAWRIGRNYQLFRHQLGTNAGATWPTKFNGGNFTFDPCYVDPALTATPDYRAWGGGTFTAQNQRLVHWPMLKSGDAALMAPQLDFYRRLQRTAELRTHVYWRHRGACFVEQIENFGLCCGQEWGWHRSWDRPAAKLPGVEDSAFVSYLWDTVLEFCLMMLEAGRFTGRGDPADLAFIDSCVTFFDEHYRQEHRRVSGQDLDADGRLVLYPGTACETYKDALDSTVTIAGLDAVLRGLLALPDGALGPALRERYRRILASLPPIPTRIMAGRRVIAPARLWDRIQNVELPQLYPVFPYGQYGVGRPDLALAIDTWHHGVDEPAQRNVISWHQDPIFCARLGLTDEAATLVTAKLDDAKRRYPTFWGPGHDWAPDHNWGGSGMIALQEMLMQTPGEAVHLFPAWPRDWDVDFRLHAPRATTVEASLHQGKITGLWVVPATEAHRIVMPPDLSLPAGVRRPAGSTRST